MPILKVARMGHPVLRQKARVVEPRELKSVSVQRLIEDMIETMIEYRGVGLAAPQVHQDLRLFIALTDVDGEVTPNIFVNTELASVGDELVEDWEGCLSIPDIRGMVPRARKVNVKGLDRKGDRVEFLAQDFAARVIQHECDHINGVLFFDRMRSMESLSFADNLSASGRSF